MENNIKIKVCGMRQPENILQVCALSPDYLGLIFYPKSPRFVDNSEASSILNSIPNNIVKVGVFVNELLPALIEKINLFKIKTIQLHGQESPDYCNHLKLLGFTIIKAFGVDQDFDFEVLERYQDYCDYFLFDTKSKNHGGTGTKFDWTILKKYNNSKPIFLSGGIGPNDAESILKEDSLNIHAIDINSKFELEPALKNIPDLRLFIKTIR